MVAPRTYPHEETGSGMKRGKPLKRTAMKQNPRNNTGPNKDIREAVWARADNLCERCGGTVDIYSIHHRRRRGMGGTKCKWINDISNLILLCGSATTGCHGYVESHREESYLNGWLLRNGELPWEVPILFHRRHSLVLYKEYGRVYLVTGQVYG